MVIVVLMAAGALAVVVAWRLVRSGTASIWVAMGAASGGAGLAALATGRLGLSPRVHWVVATWIAAGTGVLLYAATVAFVLVVRRWDVFERHVAEIYDQRKGLSVTAALVIAAGLTGPGEEFFWRGLVQGRLAEIVGSWPGAALTWAGYVAANAASQSLPIVAGAVVSGAVWGALAAWSGGVLASVVCHSIWTGLMVVWPPGGPPRRRHRPADARA